ncbi:MAG: RNA-binding transcriptional accessory protein, partial [Oscillospiraceae bacterium]|nr:RNA-binding transcriptional accessory protein [Oscillospiraceae bacterium]
MDKNTAILAREFSRREDHIENVINLIDEGNTIPFIARYRKEMHGTMDDQLLREIADRLQYLRNLDERREEIISSIEAQEKMTDELREEIMSAETLARLEDIYCPFKPKRRTRATIAREKGLEPLAALLYAQTLKEGDINEIAKDYVNSEKGVESVEDALAGASDIIAEDISDDANVRARLKALIQRSGKIVSAAATEDDSVYRLYYEYSEPVAKAQSHRILAINRGEKEGFLKVSIELDEKLAMGEITREIIRPVSISNAFVVAAAQDSYTRLLFPSLERETRNDLTDMASEQAIKMFGVNLKPLLMQPPVKNMVTMGFDPAYRTGCKIAVVDGTGKVLETGVVYPTPPHNKK